MDTALPAAAYSYADQYTRIDKLLRALQDMKRVFFSIVYKRHDCTEKFYHVKSGCVVIRA